MSLGLYIHADTPVHALAPGAKVAALALVGTVLFLVSDWRPLGGALAGVVMLYALARIPARVALAQLRPALWILGLLFLVQAALESVEAGAVLVLRFGALILLAALVTLTTRVSDMIDALEAGLRPLARIGVNPARTSLALALAIRFIPVLTEVAAEVREAQRARGLDRSLTALALPVIVRTLKMADEIADAIDARSFDASDRKGRHRDQPRG